MASRSAAALSLFVSTLLLIQHQSLLGAEDIVVVAHRGASGYLPEHTLEAKAMAHAMRADYIEQDVVLSKDDQPVILHDIHLDTVTDVAQVFPKRARDDGRYYAIDFTLSEIKTLRVTERIKLETKQAVYPKRFPIRKARFEVPTLAEEFEMIQGLNKSTGRAVGVYTEVKSPAWHREQGKDVSRIVLDMLSQFGYREKTDQAYVQCFDADELRRMREELKTRLRLVQLIGENDWDEAPTDFDELRTPAGIRQLAKHADGIGPWLQHVVKGLDESHKPILTGLVKLAHENNLEVHPYTFRADSLPDYASSLDEVFDIFINHAKVDGLFTDFPDQAVRFRDR